MATNKNELERCADEIDQARGEVVRAMRSGRVDRINAANRKLADAHYGYSETLGGRVCDDR
jgi:hypothetical protein